MCQLTRRTSLGVCPAKHFWDPNPGTFTAKGNLREATRRPALLIPAM